MNRFIADSSQVGHEIIFNILVQKKLYPDCRRALNRSTVEQCQRQLLTMHAEKQYF